MSVMFAEYMYKGRLHAGYVAIQNVAICLLQKTDLKLEKLK